MISKASLDQVNRKLQRARSYLDGLEDELKVHDADPPVVLDLQEDSFGRRLVIRSVKPIDPEWEITVGEIAFQLRSALDQAVTQVVIACGGSGDDHRGAFPIYASKDDYLKQDRQRRSRRDACLEGTPEEFRKIVDGLQPFHNPPIRKHPLWVLNSLCNAEKHRYGIPSYAALRNFGISVIDETNDVAEVFDLGRLHVSPDLRLLEGIDVFSLMPPAAFATILNHISERKAAGSRVSIETMARVGVTFGPLSVFTYQLRDIIDFVDGHVLPEIRPFVSQ
jgi:hypothetical protein